MADVNKYKNGIKEVLSNKVLLELTKEGFNNDFVRRIKNKLTYQLTDI